MQEPQSTLRRLQLALILSACTIAGGPLNAQTGRDGGPSIPADLRVPPVIRKTEDFEAARLALTSVRGQSRIGAASPSPLDSSSTTSAKSDGPAASPTLATFPRSLSKEFVEAARAVASRQRGTNVTDAEALEYVLGPQGAKNREAAVLLNALLRPCLTVCGERINAVVPDVWKARIEASQAEQQRILRSTGTISVDEGGGDVQLGTGFVIAPGVIATNRHVAQLFSSSQGKGSPYQLNPRFNGGTVRVTIDFGKFDGACNEGSQVFPIERVLYVEEGTVPDVALLAVAPRDAGGQALPPPLPLVSPKERAAYESRLPSQAVYVVGYPQKVNFFFTPEEETIFGNIFNVKRISFGGLLPGSRVDGDLQHDCQTLGGSSGSPLIDLASGKVIGLHHDGQFRVANFAASLWSIMERPGVKSVVNAAGKGVVPSTPPHRPLINTDDPKEVSPEGVLSGPPRETGTGARSVSTPSANSDEVIPDPPRVTEAGAATHVAQAARSEAGAPPLIMVSFDENGRMIAPETFRPALDRFGETPTDVYVMSHGWNNSPAEALSSYTKMISLVKAAADGDHTQPASYRPMMLGVRWPSKAWIDEGGGESAGAAVLESGAAGPAGPSINPRIVAALYENLPRDRATDSQYSRDVLRLQELLVKPDPGQADFRELLTIFRRYAIDADFPEDANLFNSDEGLNVALGRRVESGRLEAAYTPLDLARVFTYWQMKGRAGKVGRLGVRGMIATIQGRYPTARIHLFGHSFGSKVVLAAIAERDLGLPRPVNTVVLIQGAVSLQAMADRVTDTRLPGGYRAALDPSRVKKRIIVTFSRRDVALNRFYPLASRIAGQTGEVREAAAASKYSALGAVGAYGADSQLLPMNRSGLAYTFTRKVVSVDGGASSEYIGGHSEIFNANVAWLLWSAVKESF